MFVTAVSFKSTVKRLQELKMEIEHLQHLLEMSRVKLMKDFDVWWSQQEQIAKAKVLKLFILSSSFICSFILV